MTSIYVRKIKKSTIGTKVLCEVVDDFGNEKEMYIEKTELQGESFEQDDDFIDDVPNEHNNYDYPNDDHDGMESNGKKGPVLTSDGDIPEMRNWPHRGVMHLIALYKKFLPDFKNTTVRKDAVWRKISRELGQENFKFTAKQAENKWKNLRKLYIAKKDNMSDKSSGAKHVSFNYFEEMNDIYGQTPVVEPVAIAASSKRDCNENDASGDGKSKKIKLTHSAKLHEWTREMLEESKKREDGRERRHQENISIQTKAIETYTNMMEKLLEKL